jgi:hypothetical protein
MYIYICMYTISEMHKKIVIMLLSAISSIVLLSQSSYGMADMTMYLPVGSSSGEPEEVLDQEVSFDAKRIIPYCYNALDGDYSSGYNLNTCDLSIAYFDVTCQEAAGTLPSWHYCTSQQLRNMMDMFIEERDLAGMDSPGFYYPLN